MAAASPRPILSQAAAAEAGAAEGVAPTATNNAALHALQELFANMKNMEVRATSAGCACRPQPLQGPVCRLPAPHLPIVTYLLQVAALREALAQRHVNTQGTRQILMAKLTEELKKVGGGGAPADERWSGRVAHTRQARASM